MIAGDSQKGRVLAISVSEHKGTPKNNVSAVQVVADWGIQGDAHAGRWHRQVSLLASESIEKLQVSGMDIQPGAFAENITTEGIDLGRLQIGDCVSVGETLLKITQIGKECHKRCAIYDRVGDCVMPKEGIFAAIAKGGKIRVGDHVWVSNRVSN